MHIGSDFYDICKIIRFHDRCNEFINFATNYKFTPDRSIVTQYACVVIYI